MKISLYLILILLTSPLGFALTGTVTVLNAPLRSEAGPKGMIVQYLRRGSKVTIIDMPTINSKYLPVWDKLAQVAYVRSQFVRIDSGDSSELKSLRLPSDPTDYRLNEPMSDDNPAPAPKVFKFK